METSYCGATVNNAYYNGTELNAIYYDGVQVYKKTLSYPLEISAYMCMEDTMYDIIISIGDAKVSYNLCITNSSSECIPVCIDIPAGAISSTTIGGISLLCSAIVQSLGCCCSETYCIAPGTTCINLALAETNYNSGNIFTRHCILGHLAGSCTICCDLSSSDILSYSVIGLYGCIAITNGCSNIKCEIDIVDPNGCQAVMMAQTSYCNSCSTCKWLLAYGNSCRRSYKRCWTYGESGELSCNCLLCTFTF